GHVCHTGSRQVELAVYRPHLRRGKEFQDQSAVGFFVKFFGPTRDLAIDHVLRRQVSRDLKLVGFLRLCRGEPRSDGYSGQSGQKSTPSIHSCLRGYGADPSSLCPALGLSLILTTYPYCVGPHFFCISDV